MLQNNWIILQFSIFSQKISGPRLVFLNRQTSHIFNIKFFQLTGDRMARVKIGFSLYRKESCMETGHLLFVSPTVKTDNGLS